MRALLRRPQDNLGTVLQLADLELDTANYAVARAGRKARLSSREYAFLST